MPAMAVATPAVRLALFLERLASSSHFLATLAVSPSGYALNAPRETFDPCSAKRFVSGSPRLLRDAFGSVQDPGGMIDGDFHPPLVDWVLLPTSVPAVHFPM